MQDIVKKADVLIEALPYIKTFSGRIVTIKYGGSALLNKEIWRGVLEDIVFMSFVGLKPVLIHGGGPLINGEMKKHGKKIEFVRGLRVTDKETIKIVAAVLAEINKELVTEIEAFGGKAKGFSGKPGCVINAKPSRLARRLGMVGDIVSVNPASLKRCLSAGIIPVISPLGKGRESELYNINADEAAAQIAAALGAEKMVLLTNVKGIMRRFGEEKSLISHLTMSEANNLIAKKVIQEGMIPKVKACVRALKKKVHKTHIIDAHIPHALLLEIFTDKGIGTEIVL